MAGRKKKEAITEQADFELESAPVQEQPKKTEKVMTNSGIQEIEVSENERGLFPVTISYPKDFKGKKHHKEGAEIEVSRELYELFKEKNIIK